MIALFWPGHHDRCVLVWAPSFMQPTLLFAKHSALSISSCGIRELPRDKHAKLHCRKLFVALPMRIRACVTSLRSEPTKLCALTVSENLHSRQRSTEMQREIHLRGGKRYETVSLKETRNIAIKNCNNCSLTAHTHLVNPAVVQRRAKQFSKTKRPVSKSDLFVPAPWRKQTHHRDTTSKLQLSATRKLSSRLSLNSRLSNLRALPTHNNFYDPFLLQLVMNSRLLRRTLGFPGRRPDFRENTGWSEFNMSVRRRRREK